MTRFPAVHTYIRRCAVSYTHLDVYKRQGGDYRAEVPLAIDVEEEEFILTVDGRADGIFTGTSIADRNFTEESQSDEVFTEETVSGGCASGEAGTSGQAGWSDSVSYTHLAVYKRQAIRTAVVLIMAWGIVFLTGGQNGISGISRKSWMFLILSGLATGASWLCYYRALQIGEVSRVVPVDKLSVVITLVLAFVFLKEPFTAKRAIGAVLITCLLYTSRCV